VGPDISVDCPVMLGPVQRIGGVAGGPETTQQFGEPIEGETMRHHDPGGTYRSGGYVLGSLPAKTTNKDSIGGKINNSAKPLAGSFVSVLDIEAVQYTLFFVDETGIRMRWVWKLAAVPQPFMTEPATGGESR